MCFAPLARAQEDVYRRFLASDDVQKVLAAIREKEDPERDDSIDVQLPIWRSPVSVTQ